MVENLLNDYNLVNYRSHTLSKDSQNK